MREHSRNALVAGVAAAVCLFDLSLAGQTPLDLEKIQPRDRIRGPIHDRVRVTLPGNRHPLARIENDAGAVPADTRLERMMLVLRPDRAQQQALETLLEEQQDPQSPLYHHWLTPETFGRVFGISDHDLGSVVAWLESSGFAVEPVSQDRGALIFSGTAAQISQAFGTQIRRYLVNGQLHHANAGDPQIPMALAAVVSGVVSLHDFQSAPQHAPAIPLGAPAPEYSSGSYHYLSPADFATIYDLAPLYGGSTNGSGQSIAVVGRSNIAAADLPAFRSRMGLAALSPTVVLNGPDPGVLSGGEQMEAELDVEWSGAVAKNAAIQFVVSASTTTTDGVDLSAQYIVSHNLAPVVTLSFGSCEAAMGAAENQFWNALWQQAAAQGMSVFVAAGDSGAAGCDSDSANSAVYGWAVNGLCSSPYSTCVGGTTFNDTANPALYWSPATNPTTLGSALTYIPEAAWNQSGAAGGSALWSTGGGASIVYAKPSWQTGPGVPADGRRDVPDVALTAAAHDAYLVVMNGGLYAVSGTSAATPSFAGIAALVVEREGARQGNMNPALYMLASRQVSGGGAVFHDVTAGNNSVNGVTGFNAGPGYDQATGLGSVDANQLVNAWGGGSTPIPALQLSGSAASVAITQGKQATTGWTVTISGGFKSTVTLLAGTLPSGLTGAFAPNSLASPGSGTSTLTLSAMANLAPGTYNLVLTATGGGISTTAPLAVSVSSNCAYSLSPTSAGAPATISSSSITLTDTAGCSWTAASSASWITISGGSSGSGNGKISYAVAANTSAPRSGTIAIAGLTFTVTQAGNSCSYKLTLGPLTGNTSGSTGSIAVAAPAGCSWTSSSNASWITIGSGAYGNGNGSVAFFIAANKTGKTLRGTFTVAGYTITVTVGITGSAEIGEPVPILQP